MRWNRSVDKIASIILIIIIFTSVMPISTNAKAAQEPYIYESRDGKLRIVMYDGTITITAKSNAASTDIRWRTIGLNITKNRINSTGTVSGYTGPGSVSDAGKKYYLPYDGYVKRDETTGDTNTKEVEFDQDAVEALLGTDFDEVEEDTIIYMHAVFQTYDAGSGAIRSSILQNWKSIMEAEDWGGDTLSDFEKYYNMPLQFKPQMDPYPSTIMYHSKSKTGPTLKEKKALPEAYVGEITEWSNEPKVLTNETSNGLRYYDLIGYEVYARNAPDTLVEEYYLEEGEDQDAVAFGSTIVKKGGMLVYLIYQIRPLKPGDPTPAPTPIPVPTQKPKPTPTPIIVPEPDEESAGMTEIEAIGNIRADNRGNEKFTVTAGVPTTESLYTEVKSTQWLMGYDLEKKVGIETYAVRATKNYELSWIVYEHIIIEGPGGLPIPVLTPVTRTETVPVTQTVSIQRAYGYWEINNFDLYKINNARIDNYALPGGSTIMMPDYSAGYSPAAASTSHSSSKSSHIIIPSQITGGVRLSSESISGGLSRPSIPSADFTEEADSIIPELTVKNDSLILNAIVVMSDTPTKKEGPDIKRSFLSGLKAEGTIKCNENILYKPDQVIQDIKKNGTYNSSGVITYSRINSVNSNFNSDIYADIKNLSSVVIHTPVLCDPIVRADNDRYVQLINPSNATQLVLDPEPSLNDFTVYISNTGLHSYKTGYFTRDFSHSLRGPDNVSYIASENGMLLNEVKFPFDVYMKQPGGDVFIKKNTWIVLDRETVTFYLPMWVAEGIYNADCRTIAVNADRLKLDQISEEYVNSELFNYVATNTFKVEVSGRLYELSVYDLTDYPMWQEVFRVTDSLDFKIHDREKYPDGTDKPIYSKSYSYDYAVGTKDRYGKETGRNVKYTFPLVNGSHPFFQNIGVLKTGYTVRFTLDTIGCMYSEGSYVKIKPSFYYVDAEGKNRTAVDLYYEETIDGKERKLVKMGNSLDRINMKTMEAGSPYTGIPRSEMKDTAALLNQKYSSFLTRIEGIFTFKDIRIPTAFRTFINRQYTTDTVNSGEYPKISEAGITTNTIMKQMQSWYGCYYLPGILHAAPQGYDIYGYAEKYGIRYTEEFWKKDGFIIVNFDIVTVDSTGKEHLSYINASNYLERGNNSMWVMEGAPLSKTDYKDVTFHFKAGDFIIYNTDKSIHDDYSAGGIY